MLSVNIAPHVVRSATPADAAQLAQLCEAHAAFERLPYRSVGHAQRLYDALASGHIRVWLLEQGRVVTGYASTTLDFSTLSGQPFAHLDCLYLVPAARKQGGGRALMQAVQAYAQTQGCAELQWQTPDWNRDAIRFYMRLGATGSAKQRFRLALAT